MTSEEVYKEVAFLLSLFDVGKRPVHERIISGRFAALAGTIAGPNRILPLNEETPRALRKLLEAREAAILSLYRPEL